MSEDKKTSAFEKMTTEADGYNSVNNYVSDKKDAMLKLLTSLSKKTDFNVDEFEKELDGYLASHNRLFYSEITTKVQKYVLDPDSILDGVLLTNVDSVCDDLLQKDPFANNEDTKIMLKMHDHVNLVINQTKNTSASFKKSVDSVKSAVDEINKGYKEVSANLETTKNSIYSQLISIVAIFVAISFVMFGGMSMMNNLFDFSNMESVPIKELLSIGAMIGLVMFVVIFMLLNFIVYLIKPKHENMPRFEMIPRSAFWGILVIFVVFIIGFAIWAKY